jgi:glycerol kinase
MLYAIVTEKYADYPMHIQINEEPYRAVVTAEEGDAVVAKNPIIRLIGSIDQGTSSSRFIVFTDKAQILASAQIEHTQYYPSSSSSSCLEEGDEGDDDRIGWHEHDPLEIWYRTKSCIEAVAEALERYDSSTRGNHHKIHLQTALAGIGITNQRETTVAWNAETGKPYYRAIVWDDVRTNTIARTIAKGNTNRMRKKTGLPIASYFAGTKVRWLIDHVPELQRDLQDAIKRDQVRFGTIDTWLLYQLTGQPSNNTDGGAANVGGMHGTDVSNASRWLFLDIHKLQWDNKLIRKICGIDLPASALPGIYPSSHIYQYVSSSVPVLQGVPIAAILGDQQAALFGQCAHQPGEAKNTYGTGMFVLMNTGHRAITSKAGLITTVAYQIGQDGPVAYALEGSVAQCGSVVQWLRDQLGILSNAKEADVLACQTEHNDGIYFVPAFSGLFAPYWRSDARGCIVGMTASHHKGHICRAALEAAAYQAREVLDAIHSDSKVVLKSLRVDGGGTQSQLLMQFQADMLGVTVEKPRIMETTALGAAFAAGLATNVWRDLDEIKQFWQISQSYEPTMSQEERDKYWKGWKKAVTRSLGWIETNEGPSGRNLFGFIRRQ